MKLFVFCLIWGALLLPVWAHEGHNEPDLRQGATPEVQATPSSPPKVFDLQASSGGKSWSIHLTQSPGEAVAGEEVQLEFSVKQKLAVPDPLLGSEITVEGAEFGATLGDGTSLGKAHSEKEPGSYGLHWTPSSSGTYALQISGPEGLAFQQSIAVKPPFRQTIAWVTGASALLLALVFCLVRRRLLVAPWVAALTVCAGAAVLGLRKPAEHVATSAVAEHEESAGGASGIKIPPDLQQDLEMKTAMLQLQQVDRSLRVPGQVRVPEGSSHSLHARFPSRIISGVPRVGDRVYVGQELLALEEVLSSSERATLRSQTVDFQVRQLDFATRQMELRRQMAELQARRQVASSELRQRRLNLTRSEQLYAIQVIPLKELQATRTALREGEQELAGLDRQLVVVRGAPIPPELPAAVSLQRYAIQSPVNGVVAKVEAAPEEVVEPTKALIQVVDLSTVWISARVSETDLGLVRSYGRARIRVPAYPEAFPGRFVSVAPALDAETRTAQVFFAVDNRGGKLLDGMSAEVELLGAKDRVLLVPSQALVTQDGQARLFVQTDEQHFEARTVTPGRVIGKQTVVEGVDPGARVLISGVAGLASELAKRSKAK